MSILQIPKEYAVTFMIGNGFDRNLNLPTSYEDFYQYYTDPLQRKNDSDLITKLKKNIELREIYPKKPPTYETEKDTEINWSDLEIALGEFTGTLKSFEECWECFWDISIQLEHYLQTKCTLPNIPEISEVQEVSKYLQQTIYQTFRLTMYGHLLVDHVNLQQNYTNINIIDFNYTDHVKRLLGSYFDQYEYKLIGKKPKSINKNLLLSGSGKFHSQINGKFNHNPVIAVDNVEQLAIYRKGVISKEDAECFTKQKLNSTVGRYRETQHCVDSLRQADIIFIYGMSFGDTDRSWWKEVIRCLESPKVQLVIDDHCKDTIYKYKDSNNSYEVIRFENYRSARRKEILGRLSDSQELSMEIKNRIHIIQNSGIFSYIPYILYDKPFKQTSQAPEVDNH